jgi:hypothetical protein
MFCGSLLAAKAEIENCVLNDVVFLGELVAVGWEQRPRRVVEDTEEVDVALGFLDLVVKLLAVVADTDKLDENAFGKDNDGADKEGKQDRLHCANPSWVVIASSASNRSDKLHGISGCSSKGVLTQLTAGNVAWLTIIQKTKERGFSTALKSSAYFLTPGLTTPIRNSKMLGMKCATIFMTQKLSQMISIQIQNFFWPVPPIEPVMVPVCERMMGMARSSAMGAT